MDKHEKNFITYGSDVYGVVCKCWNSPFFGK